MVRFVLFFLAMTLVPGSTLRKPKRFFRKSKRGNWCYEDCTTDFERMYLARHSKELQGGLEALRTPGCVAPGKKIFTAGLFCSGSTLLFNQARLWMALAFPGNISTGYGPSPEQVHSLPDGKPYGALIGKVHSFQNYMADAADVVLTGRRPVQDMLIARVSNHYRNNAKVGNQSEIFGHLKKECEGLMNQQEAVYRKLGDRVVYDVFLTDYQQNPNREISNIAKKLGVCQKAHENHQLQAFVQEMGQMLLKEPQADGLITQMHIPLKEKVDDKWRPIVEELIEKDPVCKTWAAAKGDVKNNKYYTPSPM